jgi:DUSAM domain-containing protein
MKTLFEAIARNRPEWLAQGLFMRAVETEPRVRAILLERLGWNRSPDEVPKVTDEEPTSEGWRTDVLVQWGPKKAKIELKLRIQKGHAIEFTDELVALLRRSAPTAGIGEAETEEALKSPAGSQALIGVILSRFREGKERITRALFRMASLRDAGDLEGARQQMRSVLAVEVVPHYRSDG